MDNCCSEIKNHQHHQAGDSDNGKSYVCPMHPEIVQDNPGICPECGMNLVPMKKNKKKESREFNKHAGHSTRMFLKKFWVSLILTVPILLYSDLTQMLSGRSMPDFQIFGFRFSIVLSFILGSIIFFYGGWVFIAGAYRELRGKLPGMMTLIALAISSAYIYSVFTSFTASDKGLFWELATLITIMLLGHWFEMKAVSGTQNALKELVKLLPDSAEVVRGNEMKQIPLSEVREGDLIFVRPGGRIPIDGIVIEGQSEVNESMITGESTPAMKKTNSEVIAGTLNSDGSLKIRVTKIGEHTFLAGVMRLIKEAQSSKSRIQILSDRAAFYLTIVAVVSGLITFFVWFFMKAGLAFSVERLVAVLVIACPHALGLAVPLVASISTAMAAKNGFLVKQRLALESARKINVVLFDKTGTLTKGEYGVHKIWAVDGDENEILRLAASIDSHSEHFISKAIVAEAKRKNLVLAEAKNFLRISGKGVKGFIENLEIMVGGAAILENAEISLPTGIKNEIEENAKNGKTIIYVVRDKKIIGVLALADVIREESRQATDDLKKMGIKVAMVTGDSEEVAKWVSKELGIDEYFARVLPEEKREKVKLLQEKGLKTAFIGDGINDAPALAQADLGVAVGAGTNVAIESAGIILVKNDPRDIVKIIKLSKLTYAKMIQNLFWATGYNIIAMPLAAGVLYFKGILFQPAPAALLMSLSTVIVAVNAILLRRKIL